jgi:Ca-activated chloride channel family protein
MRSSQIIRSKLSRSVGFSIVLSIIVLTPTQAATNQLLLARDGKPAGEFKGLVDLTVSPGVDDARVTIIVDGQKIADGIGSPWRIPVDFGPAPVEHHISVMAVTPDRKRVQWQTTINNGHLPLTIKVTPVDLDRRIFEAAVTAPERDPVQSVSLWDSGKAIATLESPPYRFTLTPEQFAHMFVQVTARTKSGEEAADFWSVGDDVHAESVDVRTVPLFVSVIDRNGATKDDVDASLFRIIDNGTEGKIVDVSKAFKQPISIAVLIDASGSMTYSIKKAAQAARTFVHNTLKEGDRCAVFSIRDTPRREVALTSDRAAIEKVFANITASGRTSLWDAIFSAERELKDEKNRRAIVVLTDGGDTSSMTAFDEIDRLTKEIGIPLYFIAYEQESPVDAQEASRLRYLAGETGGFVVTASARDLQAKYDAIEKDLRAQYAILYQITDFAKRNQWRRVNVQLKSPQLTARTIRGYFAQ